MTLPIRPPVDDDTFTRVYAMLAPVCRRIVYRRGLGMALHNAIPTPEYQATVQDAVTDAFTQIRLHPERFDDAKASLLRFLVVIAERRLRRLLHHHLRHHRRRAELDETPPAPSFTEPLLTRLQVDQTLARLSERQADVLRAHYLAERPVRAICPRLAGPRNHRPIPPPTRTGPHAKGVHPMSLGDVLRAWRQAHGLTVREVALRTRIPLATLRGVETDTALPTAAQVAPLADLLGISTREVLRHVQASAQRMLEEALETPEQRALAARRLDAEAPGEPADLPIPLQAAIERQGHPVEATLAHWRAATPAQQAIWVAAIAADLELEGEPSWP
jgi:DNA-directed RNA polymerase specialized sigma24 family protein/transcriptional regulator with XRE-family HTH domain